MGSIKPTFREIAMQVYISICALVAVSYAIDPYAPPASYHPAPAPYHPAPAPYPYHEETPKNYHFGYDVHGYDEYGNPNVHSRTEARDGYNVKGQYRVELPDCRTQIVDYFVDEYKQYHADVKYEGEICPDKSLLKHKKGPYHPAPAPYHAPAPAPYHPPAPAPYHAPAPAPYHAPVPVVAPAPYHPPAPAPYHPAAPVAPVAHGFTPFVHHA